jgi:hypothetical protein
MGREIRQRTIIFLSTVANLLGTGALALAGWYGWSDYDRTAVTLLVVGAVLQVLVPAVTVFLTVRSEARTAELNERKRALSMFVEVTHGLLKLEKGRDLRVTLLEVNNKPSTPRLEQVVRFTDTGRKQPGSSTMAISQGVAGKCYRDGRLVTANFATGEFVNHMVDLGFTKREARQFERRGSYMCAPVFNSMGEVIAVLSLDAKPPDAFTPDHGEIAEWVTPFFARFLTEPERDEAR